MRMIFVIMLTLFVQAVAFEALCAKEEIGPNGVPILEEGLSLLRNIVPESEKDREKIRSQFKELNLSKIHKSNLFGSSLGWELRSALKDEFFNFITNLEFLEFQVLDSNFNIGKYDASLGLSLDFQKKIFYWRPEKNDGFEYMVKDTAYVRPKLGIELAKYFGANAEMGYIFSRYTRTKSPYIFNDPHLKEQIRKGFNQHGGADIVRSRGTFVRFMHKTVDYWGGLLTNGIRSIVKNSEDSLIYSQNFLSGVKLPIETIRNNEMKDKKRLGVIFPFSAEAFQKDIGANLNVGDAFQVTIYVKLSLEGRTTTGVSSFSAGRSRRYSISYSFLKMADNKYKLKIETNAKSGYEGNIPDVRLRIGPFSYHPLVYRVGISGSKKVVKGEGKNKKFASKLNWDKVKTLSLDIQVDRVYNLDLSESNQRRALDAAFSLDMGPIADWAEVSIVKDSYHRYQKFLFNVYLVKYLRNRSYGFQDSVSYYFNEKGEEPRPPEYVQAGSGEHSVESRTRISGIKNQEFKLNGLYILQRNKKGFHLEGRVRLVDLNFSGNNDSKFLKKVLFGLFGEDTSIYNLVQDLVVQQDNRVKQRGKQLDLSVLLQVPFQDVLDGIEKLDLKDRKVVEKFFRKNSFLFNLNMCSLWRSLRLLAHSERLTCTLRDIMRAKLQSEKVFILLKLYHSLSLSNKARLMGFLSWVSGGAENPDFKYRVVQTVPGEGSKVIAEVNDADADHSEGGALESPETRLLLNIDSFDGHDSVIQAAEVFKKKMVQGENDRYYLEVISQKKFEETDILQVWMFEDVFVRSNKLLALVSSSSTRPVKKGNSYIYQFELDSHPKMKKLLKEQKGSKISLQFRFALAKDPLKGISVPASEIGELVFQEDFKKSSKKQSTLR